MLLTMKLGVILLFVFVQGVFANGFSQNKVTIEKSSISYGELFEQIKKQTGLTVVYSNNELNKSKSVEANFRNVEVEKVLDKVLAGTGLGYELQDEFIVLKLLSQQQNQKKVTVTGQVCGVNKEPLPGVTVTFKGATYGTVTDINGKYRLEIPEGEEVILRFSFIGMEAQEIAYAGKNVINVTMKERVIELESTIVTGYMSIGKNRYTGAVDQVKAEDILVPGENTIDQMLQGVIPGLQVMNTSGQVGATPKIRIRGTSTLLGNQEPVWVVDGVVQRDPLPVPDGSGSLAGDVAELREIASNAISWLNPADIETITVLKDASATAIYGTQAANGVIVITTKKGKTGGISVAYSGIFSVGQKPGYHLYDLMNSQELMQFAQEMYDDRDSYSTDILPIGYGGLIYGLKNKTITHEQFVKEFRKMENQNTDWFDLLFRNSFSQNHSISISGGSDRVVNRTSFGINKQNGEAKGNNLLAFTATSNTTFRSGERLIVSFVLNGSIRETEGFAYGVNPFNYAYNTARTIPMYNEDGTLFYHEKRGETSTGISNKNTYLYNIQNEINTTGNTNITKLVGSTIDIQLKLIDGLQYKGLASYSVSSSEVKSHATELSYFITQKRGYEYESVLPNSAQEKASRLPYGGLLQLESAMNKDYTVRNSLQYNKTFNDIHFLGLQLGIELRSSVTTGNLNTRYGYLRYRGEGFAIVPLNPVNSIGSPEDLHEAMRKNSRVVDQTANKLSEYFTAIYGFKERYIVNFNTRVDASNRFGQDKNKKYEPQWSIGAKWRIANESFMKAVTWLNSFDISASYGYQGNAVDAVSPYLIATDGGLSSQLKQYTLNIKSLPYPDLGWEKTNSWNFNLDFSVWDNRLNFTANMYKKDGDVIASRDVPVENGFDNAYVFGSKVENRGYDLIVNLIPIRTKDFTWQFSVNTGVARNTLRNNHRVNALGDYLNGEAIVNGEAYSTFYSYAFNGLDPNNGRPVFNYMDIDLTDNYLNFLVKTGKLTPDFSGGFNTMLRYKNVSLRAQFAMSFGSQKRLPAIYPDKGAPTPEQNAPRYLKDRWRKPGDEKWTNIPSIPEGNLNKLYISLPYTLPNSTTRASISPYTMYNQSDYRVADADFIRCRQIGVQYDLSPKIAEKIYAKRLSMSLSMTNPFFYAFDKAWKGMDPETGGWPARRMTSLSINMSF